MPHDIEMPDIKMPDIMMPDIQILDVEMADFEMPLDVEMPDVEIPDVETPEVEMADVKKADVKMAGVEIPDVEMLNMTSPPSNQPSQVLASKRSSTKRPISLVSTAGIMRVTKYRKIRNAPPKGAATSPGSTRTSRKGTRRSPRPTPSYRVATAFAVSESESLDSSLDDLVAAFKRLHITSVFEAFPNEVLLNIFEHLAPTPVTPRGDTKLGSLRWMRVAAGQSAHSPPGHHGAAGRWVEYLNGRNDIKRLCLVNKKFRFLATPLLYRSILIWEPKHIWGLGRAFAADPSPASHVRHFNCAVDLEQADTRATPYIWEQWRTSTPRMGQGMAASHPYHRFLSWFAQCEAATNSHVFCNPRAGQAFFCALLCLTNRVETLNVLFPNIFASGNGLGVPGSAVPSLWKWFVEDNNPFAEFSKVIPRAITAGSPTEAELLEGPCWPPPWLRNITVEISQYSCSSGSYIHLDVIPPVDAMQHASLLKLHGLVPFDPVDLLWSHRLRQLNPSEMLRVTGYLDGLGRIPYIADSCQAMATHIGRLKEYDAYLSSPDYDRSAAAALAHVLGLLPAPGKWNSRLITRSRAVSLPLCDLDVRNLDTIVGTSSVSKSSLTITFEIDESHDGLDITDLFRICSLEERILNPARRPRCIGSLQELHLPLRLSRELTYCVYHPTGDLRFSSPDTGPYLPNIKVLEITTEALFGSLDAMRSIFASVAGPRSVEALVDQLPPGLRELKLIEWWWQYSQPVAHLPHGFSLTGILTDVAPEEWPQRYKRVQRAFVAALEELAVTLATRRRSVDRVTVKAHSWTPDRNISVFQLAEEKKKEAGQIWISWAKEKKLKGLKKVFRKEGIAFKVMMWRDSIS